jgi:serine/threonine protein kinase
MTSPSGADPLRDLLQARLGAQYEIERLLGQGGMGSVYLARDKTLDRPVAIKVIGGDVTTNAQLRERFLLEARTVAKMRHPNLVAVYSAGDADGLLYFVMEYVPGESLRDLLTREGKVEKGRAERILHEMSLALDYAHANGIVHRDVKPENILLDRDTGRAMLTDFGVARALEGDGRMTGTGLILGSPRYMSPEQASGETTLDGRSDLYSLALVGYEMFTGKPVVESGNIAGMLVKHLTETPKPLAEAVVDVPEGAATAIDPGRHHAGNGDARGRHHGHEGARRGAAPAERANRDRGRRHPAPRARGRLVHHARPHRPAHVVRGRAVRHPDRQRRHPVAA